MTKKEIRRTRIVLLVWLVSFCVILASKGQVNMLVVALEMVTYAYIMMKDLEKAYKYQAVIIFVVFLTALGWLILRVYGQDDIRRGFTQALISVLYGVIFQAIVEFVVKIRRKAL